MRFDQLVIFVQEGNATYNPQTSQWEGPESASVGKWCHVHELNEATQVQVFGEISPRSLRIIFPGPMPEADHLIFQGAKYKPETSRTGRGKTSVLATQLMGGGAP